MIGVPAIAQDNIEVDGIETRLRKEDTHGNVSYSIQATVRNSGDTQVDVSVTLQAVAGAGIEVETAKLRGKIGPQSARVLKRIKKMRSQDYEAIDKWQVKDIFVFKR